MFSHPKSTDGIYMSGKIPSTRANIMYSVLLLSFWRVHCRLFDTTPSFVRAKSNNSEADYIITFKEPLVMQIYYESWVLV